MDTRTWVRRYLQPPCGRQVRRFVALLTLAVGLPRLPWPGIEPGFSPLRCVDPWIYGILTTALGVALLATAYRGRLQPVGRVTAAIGVVVWVTLAAATPSATSLLIDVLVAATLLAEVWTMRSCDDDE